MKRIIALMLTLLLPITAAGCVNNTEDGKLHVICTVFPQYDWIRNIVGNTPDVKVSLLMDNGADLHNYQTSVEDLTAISTCDLFVYIGGESDKWTEDALKNPVNKERKTLALMDAIEEPLCLEHEHDHEHEEEEHGHGDYDEHLWLSLKNAEAAVTKLGKLIGEIDPENADAYTANADAYTAKLNALDQQYQAMADGAKRKTLVFADRFPFRYLAHDYDLHYEAAFSGCSADVEISFSTMAHLIEFVDNNSLPCVMVTESGDQKLASTVISKTKAKNQEILVMDSLQSVTKQRVEDGETYLSIMEKNLTILKKALY